MKRREDNPTMATIKSEHCEIAFLISACHAISILGINSGMSTKAIILAAGVGARLGAESDDRPKALLQFDGASLLARHVETLTAAGVSEIAIGVGFRAELIEAELRAISPPVPVRLVANERYRDGSIVTLWCMRHEMTGADDILLMDADVLYDKKMITRLLASEHDNCLLYDGDFVPGNEPVKICVRDGRIVDFRKEIETEYDHCGESVGFFRLSPETAGALASRADDYVMAGRIDQPYEEAIRDLLIAAPNGGFGYEDVTGVAWVEIDFPEDVTRAQQEILPRIAATE
jgi:choline kinase